MILRDLAIVDAVQVLDVAGPHRLLHEVDGDELLPRNRAHHAGDRRCELVREQWGHLGEVHGAVSLDRRLGSELCPPTQTRASWHAVTVAGVD